MKNITQNGSAEALRDLNTIELDQVSGGIPTPERMIYLQLEISRICWETLQIQHHQERYNHP